MNSQAQLQIWDLWFPQAGATGIPFGRGRLEATKVLLVHAPPPMLTVEVRNDQGQRLAYAQDLAQTADRPIARLMISRRTHYPRRFVANPGRSWLICHPPRRRGWPIKELVERR